MAAVGVHDVVGGATHADRAGDAHRQRAGSVERIVGAGTAIHATGLDGRVGRTHDFGAIAANHRRHANVKQLGQRAIAIRRGARTHRVKHHRDAARPGGGQRQLHALHPVRIKRADVEHQRLRDTGHVGHLLVRMRHHRRSACSQQHIGAEAHYHQIGDVMHERAGAAHGLNVFPQLLRAKGNVMPHELPLLPQPCRTFPGSHHLHRAHARGLLQ